MARNRSSSKKRNLNNKLKTKEIFTNDDTKTIDLSKLYHKTKHMTTEKKFIHPSGNKKLILFIYYYNL